MCGVENLGEDRGKCVAVLFVEGVGEAVGAGGLAGGEVSTFGEDVGRGDGRAAGSGCGGENFGEVGVVQGIKALLHGVRVRVFGGEEGGVVGDEGVGHLGGLCYRWASGYRFTGIGPVGCDLGVNPLVTGAGSELAVHGCGTYVMGLLGGVCVEFKGVVEGAFFGGELTDSLSEGVYLVVGVRGGGAFGLGEG